MCLPKKCCFTHSLKSGIHAIIFYDGILVLCYFLLAFGLTIAVLTFNIW